MRGPRDWGYPEWVLAGVTVAVAIAIVVAASTSAAAFGVYNAAWDGTSGLQTEAEAVGTESRILLNTSSYDSANATETLAVVLAPTDPYNASETRRVRRFVERGGTLLVAEDVGTGGNRLLTAVGAEARVNGSLLRDERHHYRSPAMPRARNVSSNGRFSNVDALTLNYGSVVDPANATVLVRSSAFAYLDRNGNARPDDTEPLKQYPVVTSESVGEGRVIVVSDPSVFINAMIERPGNAAFTRHLLARHERVLLDYSHAGSQPPLAVAVLWLRRSPLLQLLVGGIGIAVVWGLGTRRAAQARPPWARRDAGRDTPAPEDGESRARTRSRNIEAPRGRVMAGTLYRDGDEQTDE